MNDVWFGQELQYSALFIYQTLPRFIQHCVAEQLPRVKSCDIMGKQTVDVVTEELVQRWKI